MTPREAVEFFATQIEQQARTEDVHLTDVEKLMLRFSEIEPDGWNDRILWEQFDRDYEMEDYEQKMGDLLVRSYDRKKSDSTLGVRWKEAKSAMGKHDYYIWLAVWRAFPETEPGLPIPQPTTVKDQVIYLAVALAVIAVLLYYVFTGR